MSTIYYESNNTLYHHGIKGQKWGVRRFQNKDGSYTSKGKVRRNDSSRNSELEKFRTNMIKDAPKTSNSRFDKKWWKDAPDNVIYNQYKAYKKKPYNYNYANESDIKVNKGTDIHRMIPKEWLDNEKIYDGRAYASYTKDDVKRYRDISRMFGSNNYIDMRFKASEVLVSPSMKKRVDTFIKVMDENPKARNAMIKSTRNPLTFVPKKYFDKLDDPKIAHNVYRKFSYLLVSKKDLRDPYFNEIKKQGYNMIIDDADAMGGVSKSPIIVFDRKKSLKLEDTEIIQ